jgi:hypothetical protein
MKLFPPGICEYCGRSGEHSECEQAVAEAVLRYQKADEELLRKYAEHGAYGVHGTKSAESFAQACASLEGYLGRPLAFDRASAIEASSWWFLPEGWIGMIGFIVEKGTGLVYPLGSGLGSRTSLPDVGARWSAILEYVSGHVQPVRAGQA